ncbi:MAG: hypothetical protein JSS10_06800 [Verrucomicrobia bacterium]|nr:hypothetical protein [Verrucomicrobiota bacterium]
MAANIIRGVCGLAWVGGLYLGIRNGIVASPLSNNVNVIPRNSDGKEGYYEYANRMAKAIGINKEIIVIKGDEFCHYGNNLFSTRAGIQIPLDQNLPDLIVRHMIIHELVHIKCSDTLTWTFIPLIGSIFFIVMSKARFSGYGLVGVIAGLLAYRDLHKWREKQACLSAIKHSSPEMNTECLKWLEGQKDDDSSFRERCITFFLNTFNPSSHEMISYYKAHLAQKV